MRRNLAFLLTLFMVLSLCACGSSTSGLQVDNPDENIDTRLSISDTLSSEHFPDTSARIPIMSLPVTVMTALIFILPFLCTYQNYLYTSDIKIFYHILCPFSIAVEQFELFCV